MKHLLLFLLFCAGFISSYGQNDSLSVVENYVQLALQNGFGIQERSLNRQIQGERITQAKALFMPEVAFEASYLRAGGGRTIDIPVGDLFNPVYAGLNGLLPNAPYPTNLENVSEQFLPDDFHETKLTVRQPVFNPVIKLNHQIQQSLFRLNEAQEEAYRAELAGQVRTTYYQYLQLREAINVYQNAINLLASAQKTSEALVKNDKALSDAVYRVEYDISLTESQLAQTRAQLQTLQAYFNFLLNRDQLESIEVDTTFYQNEISEPLPTLKQTGLDQRAELKGLDAALEASQGKIDLERAARLPTLNAFAEAGFQGFGYTFDSNQDYYLLGLAAKFTIWRGGNQRSRIRESQLEQQRLQNQKAQVTQNIQLQILQADHAREAAQAQYEAALRGVRSSERSFQIVKARYREGQAIALEYLDARTQLTNAQLAVSLAKYTLLSRQAELQRALGQ